jgi:hypothetical protein
MANETSEREESRRIAEMFPIEWHPSQQEPSESPRSNNEQHPTRAEAPVRTPSPMVNQGLTQNASPESPWVPISNLCRSETASRRYSPVRKSIFKTPALTFVKAELQAQTGFVKSIKSLRNQFTRTSDFRDLELPTTPTKCGQPLSNQIQLPAPYGLS